jgi:hypothetical protein
MFKARHMYPIIDILSPRLAKAGYAMSVCEFRHVITQDYAPHNPSRQTKVSRHTSTASSL